MEKNQQQSVDSGPEFFLKGVRVSKQNKKLTYNMKNYNQPNAMRGRQQHVSCERNRIYMAIFKGTEGRSLSTMEMCAMDLVAAHCVSDASLTQSQIR